MLPDVVPVLESDAVRLRPWEPRDAALVTAVTLDPLIPLITSVPPMGGPQDVEAYLDRQHGCVAEGAGFSFAVADISTDEAVGHIGLWTRDIASGRASTGYWIGEQFRRHGYAKAALSALTAWAVSLPEIERLELYVEPWNEGSWRAAEATGYKREGLLRAWQMVGDARKDMYMYSVLPDR